MEMIPIEYVIKKIMEESEVNSLNSFRELEHYQARNLFLEDVDNDSSRELTRLITEFNRFDDNNPSGERKPIRIFINSCGGSMTDGYAIIDAITMSKTPVYTIGVGVCYSAGGLVLISGHKRTMYPRGSFMFHEGSAGVFGDAGKVKNTMKFYETQLKQMQDFIITKTKINADLYEQKRQDDWYLTADECLEHGIIDEIATTLY